MLEVPGKASVPAEPRKGPLNDPASGQNLEALGVVGLLDDLDRPFPYLAQRLAQLVAGLATIGEDVSQPGMPTDNLGQHEWRAIAVLHVSGVNDGMNQITISVGHDGTLAPFGLLACIVTPGPAALGGYDALAVDDPSARRSLAPHGFPADQKQGVIEREPRPLSSHRQNQRLTVETGGKQGGSIRQGSPPLSRYRIASTIRRSDHSRGRPTRQGAGKNGSSSAHSGSVKSLGKARSARAYYARGVSVHIVDFLGSLQNR